MRLLHVGLRALLVACPCDLCLHSGVAFAVFLSLFLVVVLVLHTSKFRRFLFVLMHVALREHGSCTVVVHWMLSLLRRVVFLFCCVQTVLAGQSWLSVEHLLVL